MKVMITGHRPDRLGGYNEQNPVALRIKDELSKQFIQLLDAHPNLELITGLAQGVDTWWAELGLKNQVPVHAYLPFTGQQSKWPRPAQDRYFGLLAKCKSSKFISPVASKQAFLERNDAMIRDCDMAIAVWDGSTDSGTGYTVRRLRQADRKVIVLHPDGN